MPNVSKKTDNAHTYESYDKCHNLTYPALAGSDVYNLFLTIYSMFYLMLGHSENTFGGVMQDILICFEILRGRKRTAKSLSLHHGRESVGYNGLPRMYLLKGSADFMMEMDSTPVLKPGRLCLRLVVKQVVVLFLHFFIRLTPFSSLLTLQIYDYSIVTANFNG